MNIKEDKKESSEKGTLAFIKDIATYFMDFLETDFHKRKSPRRSIQFRNADNLLVGLNLSKYPDFNDLIWNTIKHGFDKENSLNTIEKGVYKTNIPKNLLNLIKFQSKKISQKKVNKIIKNLAGEIENNIILHKDNFDTALSTSIDIISKIIRTDIVTPFISNVEKPLQTLDWGDENSIYLMEEDLTSILVSLINNKLSEIIKRTISEEKINIIKEIESVFQLVEIKNSVDAFFENFKVTDLFNEIFEMSRNKSILDKQEFYLYFCDITFSRAKYPIFYIPFTIREQNNIFNIDFDSQVYINKKALEYIVQEYNKEKQKKGNLKNVSERIIYLAQYVDNFNIVVEDIINEIINFFELDSNIDIEKGSLQAAKSLWTRVTNNCYISLFEKSDEALVNDYEDILQKIGEGDSVIADVFNKLIDNFIHKNPEPYNPEIEDEWSGSTTDDKLVFTSPIPLNSEQLQILSAVKKDGCNYITVEGPPGTGKSHTITAIIFNAILKNQSVLVLSDKKEALDVVEDKITETMNKVRYDKNFQNPILRLGKTGSTYSQILSTSSIENIKTHYRAFKKDQENIESNIEKINNSLKEDLEAEILAYKEIDIKEIQEFFDLQKYFGEKGYPIDVNEALSQPESTIELEEFRTIFTNIKSKLSEKNEKLFDLIGTSYKSIDSPSKLYKIISFYEIILGNIKKIENVYGSKISSILLFKNFSNRDSKSLDKFIINYEDLKNWIFGYFFKKNQVEKLDLEFKKAMPEIVTGKTPHDLIIAFKEISDISSYINNLDASVESPTGRKIDFVKIIYEIFKNKDLIASIKDIVDLKGDVEYLNSNLIKYPKTINKIGVNLSNISTLCENKITEISELDFNKIIRYINLGQKNEKAFKSIPESDYINQTKKVEDLVTAQMTYIMDGRLINFYEQNRNDAKTIRDIIRKKQRFPREEFIKLKEAFPCILAGIRDYAEYIPLEPGIFDLLIIDEASQVSIAQAFPALIRAKKVLILGDKKQFSNIKSAQAKTDTNREYLNSIADSFKKNVSDNSSKLSKLEKFNIKTSILEFFEFITNYQTQLLKHFRGYKEIISYSNKYFYQDNLQVMKIRGKNIDDVIKFSFIDGVGGNFYQNTNPAEADYIISELMKLKDSDSNSSVGIITPHTNQQKLLVEMINRLPEREYFFDKLKLKIMTFDTCQGEERDIIFYSMVATKELDRLWGVFIKNLSDVDIEEDGRIKAQRLNVGFSRAKECIYLVLSKPINEYSGSIGEALRHYQFVLQEAKKEKDILTVDVNSKMEPEVMNWFYQTKFWKENKNNIEFIPQFKIGDYLKQLDKTYNHPRYKVDFLLIYIDESHREHKIIIEYDGFKEHFGGIDEINEYNYEHYYSDEDLYRQKILESYGYKFLRINKFNIGENPIAVLDKRIGGLLENPSGSNTLLNVMYETVEGLQSGEMKECPKCKEVREMKDFKDVSLISGYGRFCRYCKDITEEGTKIPVIKPPVVLSDKICPRCGSRMVLRNGRRGRFYGCSRFPYCKGTRSI